MRSFRARRGRRRMARSKPGSASTAPGSSFSADADGVGSVLKVAYIGADQVRRLVAALDLVAFDPQLGGFIAG